MQNLKNLQQEAKVELARRELARRHFRNYPKYIYEGYQSNWHTELICDALERVMKGEIRFLFIEAPPRHSKSIHVSQLFPSYVVGKNENDSVIVSSYSGDLAIDHGRETRNIINSEKYQNLFETRLAPDSSAKGKWNTNGKGAYNAVGVGGSITGKGADFFVIDDPFKDREEADSETIREARWKWLRSVARTRLSPKGSMIIMHTRWHEDDIIGRLTEGEKTNEPWIDYFDFIKNGIGNAKWVRLQLKAVATKDEEYRKEGEALWPGRYDLAELDDIKKSLGPYEWSALYQQEPVDEENREFKQDWFKYRTLEQIEKMRIRKFVTIDTALKDTKGSDYTGVTRNYVNDLNEWHFRSERYRLNSKGIVDLIFTLHNEGFEAIGIEEGAFTHAVKPFLEEEMKQRGSFPNIVMLKHNQTMKEVRIRGLIPRYSMGKIFHIQDACDDLEKEALVFPKGANDDVIDSAAYQTQIAQPPARTVIPTSMPPRRSQNNIAL